MKRCQLVAAGTIAYVLMLVATVPATVVDATLGRVSEGRLRIAEARGTIWSGAGRIQLFDASRQTGIAKIIAWHLVPGSLLRGRLACEMELDASGRRFTVTLSPARIEVTDADFSVPAAVLGIAEQKLAPFGLGGELVVQIADLMIGRRDIQANATVTWHRANSTHTKVSPLGEYELRFEHSGTARTANLRTLDGPLQLDGTGSWVEGAIPAFKATASFSTQYK